MKIFIICTDGVFTEVGSQFVNGLYVISKNPLLPLCLITCLVQLFSRSILRSRSLLPWQL